MGTGSDCDRIICWAKGDEKRFGKDARRYDIRGAIVFRNGLLTSWLSISKAGNNPDSPSWLCSVDAAGTGGAKLSTEGCVAL